jgi:L-aspartate oxidase
MPRYLINYSLRQLPTEDFPVVVVGSGVAGLSAALAMARDYRVALLTKTVLDQTATSRAQGGIASALGPGDTPELHKQDTLTSGKGLCEEGMVDILVREGPHRVRELIDDVGARFDRVDGKLALTTEGGHSKPRVVYAKGDATGSEVEASLVRFLRNEEQVEIFENNYAIDIVTGPEGCCGLLAMDSEKGEIRFFRSPAVILAAGGMGQLYAVTTNPSICTGDGVAMALRAGAEVADIEFMQFHPTSLHLPETPRWLISEALRGEGAHLVDQAGRRFMLGLHPLAELAPRDIVVNEMVKVMKELEVDHLLLDATVIGAPRLKKRFPTIYRHCLEAGIDITQTPIPVSPAAHHMSGGMVTDAWGQSVIPGLYGCGEVACTGVHGANRLASNSLLEGLVFSRRVSEAVYRRMEDHDEKLPAFAQDYNFERKRSRITARLLRGLIQQMMQDDMGFRRNREGLQEASLFLQGNTEVLQAEYHTAQGFEVQNMLTLANMMVHAALMREESRGCHFRADYPESREEWRKHIIYRRDANGLSTFTRAVGSLHQAPGYDREG